MLIRRGHIAALGCALCIALGSGCGSDDNSDSVGQTAAGTPTITAPAATTTAPEPAKPGAPSPPPAQTPTVIPAPGKVVVPDLVGQSLADAQTALAAAGLTGTAEALNGDRTAIRNDWEVCKTVPRGGKRAPGNSPIILITAAPGGC